MKLCIRKLYKINFLFRNMFKLGQLNKPFMEEFLDVKKYEAYIFDSILDPF